MLSHSQIRHITSLKQKKFREKYDEFIAEGEKIVLELIQSNYILSGIFTTIPGTKACVEEAQEKRIPVYEITNREMERISGLSTPGPVLAVVKIPPAVVTSQSTLIRSSPIDRRTSSLLLVLDDIRDPGNLGTIIRIADWFGINPIVCSENSVDQYNPKVVQATMGSIARIKVFYRDLVSFLKEFQGTIPIYGTFLKGENIYTSHLNPSGMILIGNESHGISADLHPFITTRLRIPSFNEQPGAESLNASVATAIVCSEFRRRYIL
jgi:TrmH family RNA methyltransferase